MDTVGSYRISEVSARSGFSVPTLRYYEAIRLIPPPARSASGYRMYRDEHVGILDFVVRMKRLGLPLRDIRALVEAWQGRPCGATRDRLATAVDGRLAAIRRRIEELEASRRQLEKVAVLLGSAPGAGPCGPGCPCSVDVESLDPRADFTP